MKTWSEKCRDPRWQKIRLKIMERDKWQCSNCRHSENNTLNVHHLFYDLDYENPWDYPDALLVTLCEECHEEAHENPCFIPGNFKELLKCGILSLQYFKKKWDEFSGGM